MLHLTGHTRPQLGQHSSHLAPIWPLKCRKSPFLGGAFPRTPVADPRGEGLGGFPPLFKIFFYKNAVNKQKFSIELVQNLSKSAENSHFRDSNFQNFLGEKKTP